MKIIDCEQGTPEWRQARLGRVTGSRMAELTAKGRSGPSASRANYRAELIAERLTGVPTEHFTSKAMEWGTEQEPQARMVYELMRDVSVEQVGFVLHPTIDMAGCSPDGLVETDGLVQIKCPLTNTHIATLLGAPIDGGYIKQMQWEMACTGRQFCDYVSFDPRLPAEMQLYVQRINRDPIMIAELEKEARAFLEEIEETMAKLLAKFPLEASIKAEAAE